MSTERQRKKESQRSEPLGHRLEDLYRRGADEAFLDFVHERCRSLPELPAAGLHGEVVDRRLRRTLAAGDWHQTGRIDWDQDDWEDDDEDTKEYPLPEVTREDVKRVLERIFPPPRLVMKPLENAPGPLQPEDLQPLLRPMRKRAVEEALRAGLAANRP